MKRLVLQRRAMRDLTDACAYYRREAPHMVAEFASTIDAELRHLRRHPDRRFGESAQGNTPRHATRRTP